MSEEASVKVVEDHLSAFRQLDFERALSFLDPHLVMDGSRTAGVDTGNVSYRPESLDAAARSYRGAFENYHYDVKRLTSLGTGSVLALVNESGRGRASGVPVNRSFAVLYTVIDRKIARITLFPTAEAACEAVGVDLGARIAPPSA